MSQVAWRSIPSVGFCRGSRVESNLSRVEVRGSRVEVQGSRVEGRGSREVKKFKKLISYPILNY